MKSDIKIGFLTSVDPYDKDKLSGTHFYVFQTLQSKFPNIVALGPFEANTKFVKLIRRTTSKILRLAYNIEHSLLLARQYKKYFEKRIEEEKPDVIIAFRASTHICLIKTDVPIIYFSDTTFKKMYNYYDWFSNFLFTSVWEGNYIERKAIQMADRCVFSSSWAANSAIEDYDADPDKVNVIPFGPNMLNIPERIEPKSDKPETCKLLFMGKEFGRKGGDLVYESFKVLKKRGMDVSLWFVGSKVPDYVDRNQVCVIDYINKNTIEGMKEFEFIWRDANFLFLPTRAECFGIVFVEASAWGIPSITTDTGGVAAAVQNGKNGYRLSEEANAEDYADLIQDLFENYSDKYLPLVVNTRETFEQEYAMSVLAEKLEDVVLQVVQ